MPHVVVDTNVLVRALVKSTGSDGAVFRKFLNEEIILYYSKNLFAEIARVLRYKRLQKKYHLTDQAINTFLKTIIIFGKLVSPKIKIAFCRDKDDNELLSIAKSIYHDKPIYLITADNDLLILKNKVKGVVILPPWEFLKRF